MTIANNNNSNNKNDDNKNNNKTLTPRFQSHQLEIRHNGLRKTLILTQNFNNLSF